MSLRHAVLSFVLLAVPAVRAGAESLTVPSGVKVDVRMEQNIHSDDAREGETFRATVLDPIYVDGHTAIAAGSTVDGVVTIVKSRTLGHRSGVLGLHFVRLHTAEGQSYDLDGALVGFRKKPVAGDVALVSAGKKAVVIIGNESELAGKSSNLVADAGEDEGTLADNWSRSGLSPNIADIEQGSEITFELRGAVKVQVAR